MKTSPRHARLMLLTAFASIAVALSLIALKAVVWWLSGSVAILASLLDSLMDSLASLVNLLAITYALQPADEEHRFGHGKAEALAGLGQSLLIAGSALLLARESVERLLDPVPVEQAHWGIVVMTVSIVLTAFLLVLQRHTLRQTGSTAIEADALHYFTDLAVNVGIILSLVASMAGYLWVDGTTGILIALYILHAAWGIAREATQLLLDRELPGEVRDVINGIVAAHPHVYGFHQLRTRQAGRTRFIQLHVDIDQTLTLRAAHDLAASIERRILERYPDADVIIHQDPVAASPAMPIAGAGTPSDSTSPEG